MPLPGRRMRRHEEIVHLVARDILGLSLRPRAAETFIEDMTGIPHPFLELDRNMGLGPDRLSAEDVQAGIQTGMQLLPFLMAVGA